MAKREMACDLIALTGTAIEVIFFDW